MANLLTIVNIIFSLITLTQSNAGSTLCGQLYITQSPKKGKHLELNWDFSCHDYPDTILLTQSDLRINPNAQILYKLSPGGIRRGNHMTNYSLETIQFPGNWNEGDHNPILEALCFNFFIAGIKNNRIIHSQCLSIQPAWMANFGSLRIGNMVIPGTHNSGAYQGGPPLIKKYFLNQDKNFWQQLVFGIRYFDIRIGRYGKGPKGFYINHDFIKCTALLPELESAAKFIRKSPKEVIILNFHRFPRPKIFLPEYHRELLDLTFNVFRDLIYPFNHYMPRDGPILEEFWKSGKRVIISYNNDTIAQGVPWLWPSVRRDWGNVQKIEILENYVNHKLSSPTRGNPMKVLMAQLTPTYGFMIQNFYKSLKDLANLVNRDLTQWLRRNYNINNLNIIATDFFTGNDVINLAIEVNFRKLHSYIT